MERFVKHESLAGILQPGDGTRYEMVAVKGFHQVDVIVLNESFFDRITFYEDNEDHPVTLRGSKTNPWTIKAATEMKNRLLLKPWFEKEIPNVSNS